MHRSFISWFTKLEAKGERINSILEVGCGRGVGYADSFKDKHYVGYDLSEKEIEWCKDNRKNPKHSYVCGDFVKDGVDEKFDLVFSQGTIDNIYDMNLYIIFMVKTSKKWVYITAYRGWFPELKAHKYMWDEKTACFYNDISPYKTRKVLEDLGCSNIQISPLPTGRYEIPYETVIIAKVSNNK